MTGNSNKTYQRRLPAILRLVSNICLPLLGLLPGISINAQNIPPITYLGIEQGLSNNSVRTILQDSKAFMWFGTYDGLNRYDGNTFKIFRNKYNDSLSLINNVLSVIKEDKTHRIWLGIRQGACFYNSLEDKFHHLTITDPNGKPVVLNNVIRDIKSDEQNNVFVGSETQGLFFCQSGKFPARKVMIAGHPEISSYGVQSIIIDADATAYVFLQGKGLYIYNYQQQQLVLLNASIQRANCMVDIKSALLFGASSSVFRIDKKSQVVSKLVSIDTVQQPNNTIWTLLAEPNGPLWIGTTASGLEVWDPVTGRKKISNLAITKNHSLQVQCIVFIQISVRANGWVQPGVA